MLTNNQIQYPETPDWMTEEQVDELERIYDDIIGQGEEANAPTWRINQEIRKAFDKYVKKHEP